MYRLSLFFFFLQGDPGAGGGAPAGGGEGVAGAAENAQQAPGIGDMLLPMVFAALIFWLILFRPEQKKRKKREQNISSLKKGDQVVTTGGILGKVTKIEDNCIVLQVDKDKDFKIRVLKTSVYEVLPEGGKSSGDAPASIQAAS